MRQVITVAAIGAAALLTACGAAKGAASQGPSSPAPAKHPSSCGSAVTHGLSASTQVLLATKGVLSCFSAAAAACKPASIHMTVMGVDAGTNVVFTIDAGGKPASCAVTETSQFYMVPTPPKKEPVQVTHATVITVTSKGVLLSSEGQRILIPSAVTRYPTTVR
jgi:hypothetical protein